MDILQAFALNGVSHEINILWEDDRPLFRATEIASVVDIKKVRNSIKHFKPRHKVARIVGTRGGYQEVLFLTEQGVYKLLATSRKPMAEPFQDWLEDVVVSIRKNGKYELDLKKEHESQTLQDQIQNAVLEEANKYKEQVSIAKHEALVEAFKGPERKVVYFGLITQIGKESIIKIGSSKEIQRRVIDLEKEFGSCTLFHIIDSSNNEAFEKFLHKHPMIAPFAYKEPLSNGKTSTEIFLVNNQKMDQIIEIAKRNANKFTDRITAHQTIELERFKLQRLEVYAETLKLQNTLAELQNKVDNNDTINNETINNNDILNGEDDAIIIDSTRKVTVKRGPKVQIYTAEGVLVHTFESLIEPTRENNYVPNAARNMIISSIKNDQMYKGYRWMYLDRQHPNDTTQELLPTTEKTCLLKGFVAMLNLDKNRVENVFCDQKEAAKDRKFTSSASISKAVRQFSPSGGHYFKMWFDCDIELQNEYLSRAKLPQKRIAPNGIQVHQLHPVTRKLIKSYTSIEEVIKHFKVSRQNLKASIEHGYIAKGFVWKYS